MHNFDNRLNVSVIMKTRFLTHMTELTSASNHQKSFQANQPAMAKPVFHWDV